MQQFLKDYGTLVMFVLQIGWFVVAWWFRREVATKDDVATVATDLTKVIGRIERVEAACEAAPTATDIASLRLEMKHHSGQMREFNAILTGKCDTIDAKLSGLDRVLDRAETMLDTLTRHLLDTNR